MKYADILFKLKYWIRTSVFNHSITKRLFNYYNLYKRDERMFRLINDQALSVYRDLLKTHKITSEETLCHYFSQEHNSINAYRMLSVLLYLKKLESMYSEKISIA